MTSVLAQLVEPPDLPDAPPSFFGGVPKLLVARRRRTDGEVEERGVLATGAPDARSVSFLVICLVTLWVGIKS